MAAITSPRPSTTFYGLPLFQPAQAVNPSTFQPTGAASQLRGFPVEASTKIVGTGMVAVDASGYLVNATATAGQTVIGCAFETVDNSAGAAGALQCPVVGGLTLFPMYNSAGADLIAIANIGAVCYVVDNQTVALTSAAGTRPPAGKIKSVDSTFVWVEFTIPATISTGTTPTSFNYVARGVQTANVASLAAFTVAGPDGVTYVAGDTVLLAAQTTASQNGLYTVGTPAAGTAPLTRPAGYAAGQTAVNGAEIQISEGTRYGASEWKLTTTGAITIDTTATAFYPRVEKGVTAAMTGGTGAVTVSNLFIKAGAGVGYGVATGGGTRGFLALAVTAGQGSGSLAFTSATAETSTITYTCSNW
jgi:hypothetical protein